MGQGPHTVAVQYDTVATEYADRFIGEHAEKPMDREILQKFAQALGERQPVWDFGSGPGQTTRYLNDIGVRVSGVRDALHISIFKIMAGSPSSQIFMTF